MGYTLVTAVLCLAILRLSEGVVPVITGGITQTLNMAENTAAGATAFTLTSDQAVIYGLTGTDASSFAVTPTQIENAFITGTITINNTPVYATKSSYSMLVTTVNTVGGATHVTVTLNVIKTPAFTATTFTVTPCDGATANTAITQLTATGHTGRTLVYAIASGNTASDLSISTGQISVATSKTLMKATTATYTLMVTAADTTAPVQTATTTVTVSVSDTTCGSAAITGSLAALLCMIFSIIQKLA